jgi:hypothetical protein
VTLMMVGMEKGGGGSRGGGSGESSQAGDHSVVWLGIGRS